MMLAQTFKLARPTSGTPSARTSVTAAKAAVFPSVSVAVDLRGYVLPTERPEQSSGPGGREAEPSHTGSAVRRSQRPKSAGVADARHKGGEP